MAPFRNDHSTAMINFGPAQPHKTSAETGPNWWASEAYLRTVGVESSYCI